MKTTEHVEHLLRQGRKPKELIELGFPKPVVTTVRRRLKKQKAARQAKVPEGIAQGETQGQSLPESPGKIAVTEEKLQSMANELQKVDNLAKVLSEATVLVAAAQEVGTYKRETCPYRKDGVCTAEIWTSQDEIPQGIGEPVAAANENPEWYIKPSPFYCAMCTTHLEHLIYDVQSDVSGNPLSGAKHEITCKGCGSKGLIATLVKCTKCGRETYWGWWPKKE